MGSSYAEASRVLQQGGVVAYPTEAVFGLGADPLNEAAVMKVLRLKSRLPHKGLILISHNWASVADFILPLSDQDKQEIESFQGQHPRTWVLPASEKTPQWIKGQHQGVAVRVTKHPAAKALCQAFGGVIVSTSANQEGNPPATDATQVRDAFPTGIDYIMTQSVGQLGSPSEIFDFASRRVLRSATG